MILSSPFFFSPLFPSLSLPLFPLNLSSPCFFSAFEIIYFFPSSGNWYLTFNPQSELSPFSQGTSVICYFLSSSKCSKDFAKL